MGRVQERRGEVQSAVSKAALKKLKAIGEDFMRMFDDETTIKVTPQVRVRTKETEDDDEDKKAESKVDGDVDVEEDSGEEEEDDEEDDEDKEEKQEEEEDRDTEDDGEEQKIEGDANKGTHRAPKVVVFHREKPQAIRMTSTERRQFMSSRVNRIYASQVEKTEEQVEDAEYAEKFGDFRALLREVSSLGASQLDKKDRKKWETEQFTDLGARAPKQQRIPAAHATVLNRRVNEKKAKQLEEDIASGMVRVKGRGKAGKSPAKRRRPEERGLKASDGVFKGGVLYVRPPKKPKTGGGSSGSGSTMFSSQGDSKLQKHGKRGKGMKVKKRRK